MDYDIASTHSPKKGILFIDLNLPILCSWFWPELVQVCFRRIAWLFRMGKDYMPLIVLLDICFKASAIIAIID